MTDPKLVRDDPRSLSSLPDELLVQVVSHLAADRKTLCTLARASRFFQVEAERYIYTTIELLSTNDLNAIIEAFRRRPERIASVETLKILYRFHGGLTATTEERNAFDRCVKKMKALRHWEIESPYDNYKWDKGGYEWVYFDMADFHQALESASLHSIGNRLIASSDVGLAKLERLVIHTHGAYDDFWDLEEFECLFRHPSLRYLHVSCVALPDDIPELEPYAKSTPLTELIFDECELEPKSLGRILATPKNLRSLTLGENVFNINIEKGRTGNPRLTRAPEASLAALMHVAHSLEYLAHNDPACRLNTFGLKHHPIAGDGMRDFHSLTTMRVDAYSFLHRSIALSHTQAPPNLATLQIQYPRPRLESFFASITTGDNFFERLPPYEPYSHLPSLKTLEFVQGVSLDNGYMASPHQICKEEFLRQRHAIGYKLYKHGINLKVTLEAAWKDGLIPPVLHGEPPSELICVYDAEAEGFFREPHATDTIDTEVATEAATEGVETDQLSDADIEAITTEVQRKLDRVRNRMSKMDDGEGAHVFTVVVDSDDGIWTELDEDEMDYVDEDWHDAEAYNLNAEFYDVDYGIDDDEWGDLPQVPLPPMTDDEVAQFLLNAEATVLQGYHNTHANEELTDANGEDVD